MKCPQCRSEEIGPSGICLVCGFLIDEDLPAVASQLEDKEKSDFAGMIKMDYSGSTREGSHKEDMPQWRQELSQRLQAIKQKREAPAAPTRMQPESAVLPPPASAQAVRTPAASPGLAEKPPARKSTAKPLRPVNASGEKPKTSLSPQPRQKTLQPLEPEPFPISVIPKTADAKEIQKLIDHAVSRQSNVLPAAAPKISASASDRSRRQEGKLILLSRTLSGLVDLIFIVLCTGAFIICSDLFSGIVFLDSMSLVSYAVLFLLTYFLYSIFFLAASGQTVGMMITDLRVVGSGEKRSSLLRLLARCLGYLLSLSALGFGLLWSFFDGESLCFHDRISKTRVIRIHDPLGILGS